VKPEQIREMGIEELKAKEKELREQVFRLRFQKSLGQLDDPLKLRRARRDVARVVTIRKEKQVTR
jgi:large subunit ribosomal protein L29